MKIKYRINLFQYMEFQALSEYLEAMAKKGWILEKIGILLKFRKKEPQDLLYCVDFLPKITLFSTQNIEAAIDYRQLCQESGWTFVCGYNKMQIFRANRKNQPTPLQTEEMIQYKILNKSILSIFLISLLCFVYCIFSIYMILSYDSTIIQKENDLITLLFITIMIDIFWIFCYLIHTSYQLIMNKKRIRDGLAMHFPSLKTVKIMHTVTVLLIIALFLSFVIPMFLTSYPYFYLIINVSTIFLIFIGPLIGIAVRLIREHTNFRSGVIGVCLMIGMILCVLIESLSLKIISMNQQKLDFILEHDPLFSTVFEQVNEAGSWTVTNSSTSFEIPIFYEVSFTKDEKKGAINTDSEGISISAYQMKNEEAASEQLKTELIDTYRFQHGHLDKSQVGINWVYADAPNDETLYASYPAVDHQKFPVAEGYQIDNDHYIFRNGNMVHIFITNYSNDQDNQEHLQWLKNYFMEVNR